MDDDAEYSKYNGKRMICPLGHKEPLLRGKFGSEAEEDVAAMLGGASHISDAVSNDVTCGVCGIIYDPRISRKYNMEKKR